MKPREVDWKTYYGQLWKPMATNTEPRDGMTLTQFIAARDALRGALANFERVRPNCKSCKHFDMGNCAQFGEIPAEFKEADAQCESWAFDGIPF